VRDAEHADGEAKIAEVTPVAHNVGFTRPRIMRNYLD